MSVNHIESHSSHVFFTENSTLGDDSESNEHMFLDFVHVLASLSQINQNVWSFSERSETPDFVAQIFVPTELFRQNLDSLFCISEVDVSVFNGLRKLLSNGLAGAEESVLRVGGFGHGLRRLCLNCFSVRNDGVGFDDLNLSIFIDQIIQTDFHVKLSRTSDDVLSGFFVISANDQGVRFGQSLHSGNEFWKLLLIFRLHRHSHDWRD